MISNRSAAISILLLVLGTGGYAHAETKGVTSREYKIGLNPTFFAGPPDQAFETLRKRLTTASPLTFENPSHTTVQFFDTAKCQLANMSMLLRSRVKQGKDGRVTLKIRDADILAVDSSPLRPAEGKKPKIEDDYSIQTSGKGASDFSKSFTFEGSPPATFGELGEKVSHIEDVVAAKNSDALVAGPIVAETVFVSKPLQLADDLDISVEASLWYDANNGAPVAGDVSFTVQQPFDYASLKAAKAFQLRLAEALGDMKASSGEKSLAALPKDCRK